MKKLLKKITIIAMFCFAFIVSANFIMAKEEVENFNEIEGILDTKAIDGVYKLSQEQDLSYIPMIRYVTDRIVLDKETGEKFASFFTNSSIDIDEKQEGVKCLFSNDTVRVNADMEYPIIFATQNVVIDSVIEKSIIVFGGGTVTFTENSEVKGDIICFSTSLEIKGKVNGSVIGYSNKVDITGQILRDLRVDCNELTIDGSENVNGNVFVMTYNSELASIYNIYPNATIMLNEINDEVTKNDIVTNIIKACIVSLVFAIIYALVNRKSEKFISNTIDIIKNNILVVLLSGTLSLLIFPIVAIILLILSMLNFAFIAIPILVLYLALLIIIGMLSTLIIGSIIIKYVSQKYININKSYLKFGFYFLIFLVLYGIARIPVVGSYITWGFVILAIGIVFAMVFKSNKNKK